MTIEYKDSKRITALSNDILNTPDINETFETDTKTAQNGTLVAWDSTDKRIEGTVSRITTNTNWIYDLGSDLSATKFIVDFQFDIISNTDSTGTSATNFFMITSGTGSNQNAGGFSFTFQNDGSGGKFGINAKSSGDMESGNTWGSDDTFASSTTYYMRMIRDGDDFTCIRYSDTWGGTVEETLEKTVSGVTGLRYWRIQNYNGATSSYNGTTTFAVDNLKLYNGISSTTNKPSNVQDNSLLVEKDTARRYWFSATKLVFEDDFSGTDDWTDWGSGSPISVSTTNDRLDFDVVGNDQAIDIGSQYDLTSVSDTAFVLDFDYTTTNIDLRSSGSAVWIYLGLSSLDNNGTNKDQTAQDYVGIYSQISNANDGQKAIAVNNAVIPEGDGDVFDLADGDTWYMRYVRDGNSMDITWYSDSARTSVQATKTLDVTNISDLRYFVVRNRSSAITTPNARITGYIDNVKFYNGVTSPTPATWTMQPTYEDDFSSDNFNDTGTQIGVANNTLEWNGAQNGSVHGSTIDLTSIGTKAVFRAKLRINTLTAPSSASSFVLIGFSDSDHSTAGDSSQDGIGLIIQNDADVANSFRAMHVDGAAFSPNAGTAFATVPATATDYFIEVVLDNSTWYVRIYSDSNYSVLTEQETGSMTATGLRYFGIKMRSSASIGGTFDGYIDDFKFYNGVTSIN